MKCYLLKDKKLQLL